MDIGFIGIGNMGGAMASWIPKAGYSLVVHDLDRDAAEPLLSPNPPMEGVGAMS